MRSKKTTALMLVALAGALALTLILVQKGMNKTPPTNNSEFHKALLSVASEYQTYKKVEDRMKIAPALCTPPPAAPPKLSQSSDNSTHGQKLYYLYAKDKPAYLAKQKSAAIGQAIVKESWTTKKQALADAFETPESDSKAALFIMLKLDPKTPNTHDGWVYGTVSADGTKVTSSGRVQSCMSCHESAAYDHLFGVKE